MQSDLAQLFGAAAEQIPTSREEEAVFSPATLPRPPALVITDQLYIEKGLHDYHPGEFRADVLRFHAPRATYRQLGLLIMAVVLHGAPSEVSVELRHPASAIRQLIIESPYHGPDDIHRWRARKPRLPPWGGSAARFVLPLTGAGFERTGKLLASACASVVRLASPGYAAVLS